MTPKAQCPQCRAVYYGWALLHGDDYCHVCGEELRIIGGDEITSGERRIIDDNKRSGPIQS